VAGRHIPLVSRDAVARGALWRSLSKQGVLHSWRPAATLFYYYDSLIEKCSTLSRLCFSTGVECLFTLRVSGRME
jgi:hypothetical protein